MRFGVFYELQLPRPWNEGDEHRLFKEALEQVVLADRLGFDYAWEVEHHFLDEYSHSSAPEVFLAAAAARTERIRLGHRQLQATTGYRVTTHRLVDLVLPTLRFLARHPLQTPIALAAAAVELWARIRAWRSRDQPTIWPVLESTRIRL